ncbi:MAG: TonB-dependent receptor, partial [Alphaproteobacteria bacterium]|nr:TonB-dependent receptor [Alphaproteobacteria bacterium]
SEQWNVNPVLRNDFNTSDDDTFGLGWNMKYGLSDSLKLVLDANYSHAHRHDNTYEIYGGVSFQNVGTTGNPPFGTATVTRQPDGTYGVNIAGINYANPSQVSLTDPQGWGQVGFNNVPDVTDTVKGLRAELDGALHSSFFKSWEAGVYYNDEKKVSNYSGYFICLPGAAGTATVAGCGNWPGLNGGPNSVAIPSSIITGSVEPYGVTGTNIIAVDPIAAQNLLRTAPQSLANDSARDWTVEEKVLTGYFQANIDTMAGAVPLRGNIGFQVVNTDQSSVGNIALNATTFTQTYTDTKYTYFLPAVNLNLEPSHNFFVRLAASRTLARSILEDENASYGVSYCGAQGCTTVPQINGKTPLLQGNGGNPYLRPYFSNNVDISIEKYFAHDLGKISLAGYYKWITNFTTQNQNLNSGSINANGPAVQTAYTSDCSAYSSLVTNTALLTNTAYTLQCYSQAPTNDGRGYVQGFEASFELPLKALTPALDGFGFGANYAYAESSLKFSNGQSITLPGLSKGDFQGVIWFEKYGFNARIQYEHRTAFLGDYQLFNAQVEANLTKAQDLVDAQIGYDFKKGPLNGLSVYIQGHNLTNAKTISYVNNDPNEVNIRDQYGSTYIAGVTMKF